jgi:hypothetical protein
MVCIPGGKGVGQYRHIKMSHRALGEAQRRAAELAVRARGKERVRGRRMRSLKFSA